MIKVTRFVLVTDAGVEYNYDIRNSLKENITAHYQLQDNNQTLKVFIQGDKLNDM